MSDLAGMTLADVESARELLRGVSRVTPLEGSRPLSEQVGGPVHLKCENLQRAGSFKIRGAYVRIARLSPEERARGVVAASAGNHAQGVALASSILGIRSHGLHARRGLAPQGDGDPRLRCRRDPRGSHDRAVASRCNRLSRRRPAPCSSTRSTIATSSPAKARRVWRSSSSARTCARSWSASAAVGCSPESRWRSRRSGRTYASSASRPRARPAGHRRSRPVSRSRWRRCRPWPTGSRSAVPARCPSRSSASLVDDVRTVSEESLSRALLLCLERAKMVVEPAGVAAVAGILDDPDGVRAAGRRRAVRRQRRPAPAAAGDPARPGGSRPVRLPAGPRRRLAGPPRGAARRTSPSRTPTSSRSSTCARIRACTSTRWPSTCSSRPEARSTASRSSTPSSSPGLLGKSTVSL